MRKVVKTGFGRKLRRCRTKNFTEVRKDGSTYFNERMRWPSSLGTFRHNDQEEKKIL